MGQLMSNSFRGAAIASQGYERQTAPILRFDKVTVRFDDKTALTGCGKKRIRL